jgi:hypothetical protein
MIITWTSKRTNAKSRHVIAVDLVTINAVMLLRQYRFITPWPATRVTIATEIDKRIRFDNPKVFLVIVQYERKHKLPHVTPIEWNFVGPRTLDLSAAN